MELKTRKVLDRSFSSFGIIAIILMAISLVILLAPIFIRGIGAIFFAGTVEFRKLQLEKFERGSREKVMRDYQQAQSAREPVYAMLAAFEQELPSLPYSQRRQYKQDLQEVKDYLKKLFGPLPGESQVCHRRFRGNKVRIGSWEVILCAEQRISTTPDRPSGDLSV